MRPPALTDVERAGAPWRKSTYSEDGGGSCVEVTPLPAAGSASGTATTRGVRRSW